MDVPKLLICTSSQAKTASSAIAMGGSLTTTSILTLSLHPLAASNKNKLYVPEPSTVGVNVFPPDMIVPPLAVVQLMLGLSPSIDCEASKVSSVVVTSQGKLISVSAIASTSAINISVKTRLSQPFWAVYTSSYTPASL